MKDKTYKASVAIQKTVWPDSVKLAVWKKGRINPDHSPSVLRWDTHGNIMRWSDFESADSELGWCIDFIDHDANQDPDNIDNLQPVSLCSKKY